MEYWAHQTLSLRSFFHDFPRGEAPAEYYSHLRGEITRKELLRQLPASGWSSRAKSTGKQNSDLSIPRKSTAEYRLALSSRVDQWVLCGGPPCQAFSIVGRSRNGGISDTDHRVYLYRQYLRILSVHEPPVFIMENVKGLLSSQVQGSEIFEKMLDDLRHPAAVAKIPKKTGARYSLYSLAAKDAANALRPFKPADFVVKCEDYGIPQSRHRVIILGIREDLPRPFMPALHPHAKWVNAPAVLRGLPRLRSGLSRSEDGQKQWQAALKRNIGRRFHAFLPKTATSS